MRRLALVACLVSLALAPAAALVAPHPDYTLEPFFSKDSRAWHHERSHQLVEGLRVLDAGASVHILRADPSVRVEQERVFPAAPRTGAHVLSPEAATMAAWKALGPDAVPDAAVSAPEAVWLPTMSGLRAAYEVELEARVPPGVWSVVLDGATGGSLRVEPLALHGSQGKVFGVNPIVALQDPDFRDNRASIDDGSFAGAYRDVTIDNVSGISFASERVAIVDGLALTPLVDDYRFDRADPRFLETMVYHFVELALDRVAQAGYGDMLDYQVQARAHHPIFQSGMFVSPALYPDAYAGNGMITFLYRAATPGGPGFGSGAEDAEIIVHELGHLLHFAAAPDASGGWRFIWGEGNGDFLAAILLEPESGGFGDPCISEWLATYYEGVIELFPHEGLLCIRTLENDLRMPEDFFGDLSYRWAHENGQFWSGALWQIRQDIGRDEALALFLESLYFMPVEAEGFEDLGQTLVLADFGLTGGEREEVILDAFAAKNITVPSFADVAAAGIVTLPLDEEVAPAAAEQAPVPALGLPAALAAALLAFAGLHCGRRNP